MNQVGNTNNSREIFTSIAQELAARHESVEQGQMFGMPCIKANRKAFAGLFQDDMVFKLQGDAHAMALDLHGSHLFDPMGGRPMKEWVQVPSTQAGEWSHLAEKALEYVGK
jgi:hypothetical protein